jgi:hypothetical protein
MDAEAELKEAKALLGDLVTCIRLKEHSISTDGEASYDEQMHEAMAIGAAEEFLKRHKAE